jgi:hypothetical protein
MGWQRVQLVVVAATRTTARGGILQIVVVASGSACFSGDVAAFGRRATRHMDLREGEGDAGRQARLVAAWEMRGCCLRTVAGRSGLIQR